MPYDSYVTYDNRRGPAGDEAPRLEFDVGGVGGGPDVAVA